MSLKPRTAVLRGEPCKYGHPGVRYASTHGCVECMRIYGAKQAAARSAVRRARRERLAAMGAELP
jgi:hypothetical protein